MKMAEWTGLEPATSGVTGQHSNRLNYHSAELTMIAGLENSRKLFSVPPSMAVIRHAIAGATAGSRRAFLVGTEGIEPPTRSV